MPDDLLGGALGAEDEQPEAEVPQAVAGAEAFAAAIAAIASRQDPGVARKTEVFLDKQAQLLDIQARHLEEEHASRLTQLRLTVAAAKRKRYADLMRNGLYTGTAVLVLALLIGSVRMTYEALSDHGLVVEDFTVPADLATRGVTSQALAANLANRVAAIRAFANGHSLTYSNDVRADQSATLRVQIPETGISVDELERFLHRWLGHQTVVSGELREDGGDKLTLALNIPGADPIVVHGVDTDLDSLLQTSAEKAFAAFDPVNDVIYLLASGRPIEAYDAAVRYAHSPSAVVSGPDRADAYSLQGTADWDKRRALAASRIAIDADPGQLVVWMQAAIASAALGHDGATVEFARRGLGTKRRDQLPPQRGAYSWLIAMEHAYIDQATGDFGALRSDYDVYDRRPNLTIADRYGERAQVAALLHDEATARQQLGLALAAGTSDPTVLEARWDTSLAAGDWAAALETAQALVAEQESQVSHARSPEFAGRPELLLETQYRPWLAYAEAMTGDTGSATRLIAQTPTDCYLCVRIRAKVAAAAGDAATADRWFAESLHQAPDLPMGYFEWGQALLARDDLAGAARELSLAHDKGPHFADALKVWGDVLVRQGRPGEAIAKYEEALKYAPNWAALRQARDAAGNIHHV
jgi:tetratricopeptide (TPR) repeat protein